MFSRFVEYWGRLLEVADISPDGETVDVAEVALGQLEEMLGGRALNAASYESVGEGTFSPDRAMGLSPVAVEVPLGLLAVGVAASGGVGDEGGDGDQGRLGLILSARGVEHWYGRQYRVALATAPDSMIS